MSIDWFTVVAQLINFFILIFLMKKFLYRPILGAIAAREKHIGQEMANAHRENIKAQKEREMFEKKSNELSQKRGDLLAKMHEEVEQQRRQLIQEAQVAAGKLKYKLEASWKRDSEEEFLAIKNKMTQEILATSGQILRDLSSLSIAESIWEKFKQCLMSLPVEEKEELTKALNTTTAPALLRSHIKLSSSQEDEIKKILRDSYLSKTNLRFETNSQLVAGIELLVHGRKIGWSVSDYLKKMETSFND